MHGLPKLGNYWRRDISLGAITHSALWSSLKGTRMTFNKCCAPLLEQHRLLDRFFQQNQA